MRPCAAQGRKGCPCTGLGAGGSFVMAETEGRSGVLRRIWMAVQDYDKTHCLKGLKLEIFWDGCEKPAVSVPLGDFFLHVPGRIIPVDCAAFTTTEGRSFVWHYPHALSKRHAGGHHQRVGARYSECVL